MRKLIDIAAGILWMLIIASACSNDNQSSNEEGKEVLLQLAFSGMATAEEKPGSGKDDEIEEFDILVYHAQTGRLSFYFPFDNQNPLGNPQEILVETGQFHFVFIANKQLDGSAGESELVSYIENAGSNIGNYRMNDLRQLLFGKALFGKDTACPMVTLYTDVEVLENNRVIVDSQLYTDTWKVGMERACVKLQVSLTLRPDQYTYFTSGTGGHVSISNAPAGSYLLPRASTGLAYDTYALPIDTETENRVRVLRVLLPETVFTDKTSKEDGMLLNLHFPDGTVKSATLGSDLSAPDYTLPRNTWLEVTGTVDTDLMITAIVKAWEEEEIEHEL